MLGRCGELEMPFGNYSDSDHLQSPAESAPHMPQQKAKNLLGMCTTALFHASQIKRYIWNSFKTILRNTTVHDAFYMEHYLMGYFSSKALESFWDGNLLLSTERIAENMTVDRNASRRKR